MEEKLQVGIISSTHGIRGEVKVFPTTDDVKRFTRLKNVILEMGNQDQGHNTEEKILEIEGVKFFKQFVIVKFKGIDSINDVERYKGKSLFVTRAHAVRLEKDEFFIADLIGTEVFTEAGERLGSLTDVLVTGANDVYVVDLGEGREVLLPAIKDCILNVDIKERKMRVHVMEGLLD